MLRRDATRSGLLTVLISSGARIEETIQQHKAYIDDQLLDKLKRRIETGIMCACSPARLPGAQQSNTFLSSATRVLMQAGVPQQHSASMTVAWVQNRG